MLILLSIYFTIALFVLGTFLFMEGPDYIGSHLFIALLWPIILVIVLGYKGVERSE